MLHPACTADHVYECGHGYCVTADESAQPGENDTVFTLNIPFDCDVFKYRSYDAVIHRFTFAAYMYCSV